MVLHLGDAAVRFKLVEARILTSEVSRKSEETTSHIPHIEYEFTGGGTSYTSESVYLGTDGDIQDRTTAESLVERYAEGEVVTAYYDPASPTETF